MWARQLGAHAGREHPAAGGRALLPITEQIAGLSTVRCRCSRTRRRYGYFREEVGGLMVGLFEPVCAPWKVGGVPDDFSFGEIAAGLGPHGAVPREGDGARADLDRGRRARSSSAGRRASRRTSQPIVGEAPELKNYFVAAGLNSIGILTGGGLGRVLAHWIINGRPDVDVTGFNIDRLHTLPGEPRVPARRARSSRSAWSTSATTRRARCRPRAARSGRRSTTGSPRAGAYFQRRQRLGGRRLVRAAGRRADGRPAVVGPAELVPVLGGRAPAPRARA